MYGIYNIVKSFSPVYVKGDSKNKVYKKLFDKIGNDAMKYRTVVKPLKYENPKA